MGKVLDAVIFAALAVASFGFVVVALVLAVATLMHVLTGNYSEATGTGMVSFAMMVAGIAICKYEDD